MRLVLAGRSGTVDLNVRPGAILGDGKGAADTADREQQQDGDKDQAAAGLVGQFAQRSNLPLRHTSPVELSHVMGPLWNFSSTSPAIRARFRAEPKT